MRHIDFGNHLNKGLSQIKMSQAELAKTMGISAGAVSNLVNGNDLPSHDALQQLITVVKLDSEETTRLVEFERAKREIPSKYDSFVAGLESVVEYILSRPEPSSKGDPIQVDFFLTWLHVNPVGQEFGVTHAIKDLIKGFGKRTAEQPLVLHFCTTAPSNLGLLSSRFMHGTLASMRATPVASQMEIGIGRVADKVIENLDEIVTTDAWIESLCAQNRENPLLQIEHRYNFAWTGYPVVRYRDHLALCGYYPANSGYCAAPAYPVFWGSTELEMIDADLELVWNQSCYRTSSFAEGELTADTIRQRRFTQRIQHQFSEPYTWKGVAALHIDKNFGEFVRNGVRPSAQWPTSFSQKLEPDVDESLP